jgi:ferredoxin-type protein NapH
MIKPEAVSIEQAFGFANNRAFCKYVCPVPVLQKITSRFSLLKVKIDPAKCVDCGMCEKVCPMDVKLLEYKNQQPEGTVHRVYLYI